MAVRNIFIRSFFHYSSKSQSIPRFRNQASKSISGAPGRHCRNLIVIFQRYGFLPSEVPNYLSKIKFIHTQSSEEVERLGIHEISPAAIRNVVEISVRFGLTPGDVIEHVRALVVLGFSETTITRILDIVPTAILLREDRIRDTVEFLMGIGIQKIDIDRIFGLFPAIASFSVENRLKPLLDEFRVLGFSLNEIREEVVRNPKILGFENGELSHCLEMLRSLKCRQAIKANICRDGEIRAGYEVKLRVECLRRCGLTYRDAFTVLWKEPRAVLYETQDIEKKIEFLVGKMKLKVQCLVEVPEYLGVSFDKRIVPRWNVIEFLKMRDEVWLRNIVNLSRSRFYDMYVKAYPECEKMYGRFGVFRSRSRHPVGMWKLFKPPRFPMSGEDTRNIKSNMEYLS
ncbi:transcription termination factor MTERF15, mitochondrial [Andrographis paniculata]|uniref:transcription termination factor MTERF15, mitochondrial n=1 Tax=Andrographis paniculata TaxID=175694 RepID=UPI0021E6EA4C|nr:transcription termination factor MTERF15, mitochondrial [Andrographis paniculata]